MQDQVIAPRRPERQAHRFRVHPGLEVLDRLGARHGREPVVKDIRGLVLGQVQAVHPVGGAGRGRPDVHDLALDADRQPRFLRVRHGEVDHGLQVWRLGHHADRRGQLVVAFVRFFHLGEGVGDKDDRVVSRRYAEQVRAVRAAVALSAGQGIEAVAESKGHIARIPHGVARQVDLVHPARIARRRPPSLVGHTGHDVYRGVDRGHRRCGQLGRDQVGECGRRELDTHRQQRVVRLVRLLDELVRVRIQDQVVGSVGPRRQRIRVCPGVGVPVGHRLVAPVTGSKLVEQVVARIPRRVGREVQAIAPEPLPERRAVAGVGHGEVHLDVVAGRRRGRRRDAQRHEVGRRQVNRHGEVVVGLVVLFDDLVPVRTQHQVDHARGPVGEHDRIGRAVRLPAGQGLVHSAQVAFREFVVRYLGNRIAGQDQPVAPEPARGPCSGVRHRRDDLDLLSRHGLRGRVDPRRDKIRGGHRKGQGTDVVLLVGFNHVVVLVHQQQQVVIPGYHRGQHHVVCRRVARGGRQGPILREGIEQHVVDVPRCVRG